MGGIYLVTMIPGRMEMYWGCADVCHLYGNVLAMYVSPGGGTRVHHGRVGSAGLCDLKILHPWRRLKKGVKILQWPPQR